MCPPSRSTTCPVIQALVAMNSTTCATSSGAPLPIANGAPLRVRVKRQLGYKMAKYIHTVELVESFAPLGRGRGSYWADRGYEWYAGI
jgi:DMSO/TMAO reductase YedYZ molybdopterin-dependent catalytic subunit